MAEGVEGLLRDRTRPPGKAPVPLDRTAEIVRLTQAPPPHEATHWTARAMAKTSGLAVSTCVDAPCLASMIFDLSAGSSIGRVSGL